MDLATKKMVYYGLLGLLIAGSTIAVFRVAPQVAPVQFLAKDGTFAGYFNSIPSDIQSNQGMSNDGQRPGTLPVNPHLPQGLIFSSLNLTKDPSTFQRCGAHDRGWTSGPQS